MNHCTRVKIVLTPLLCLYATLTLGQAKKGKADVGIAIGGSYYVGDLSPSSHFNHINLSAGGFYRWNFPNERVALRMGLYYGVVEAYDADSDIAFNKNRNLHFRSSIVEFGPILEINFFDFRLDQKYRGKSQSGSFATPYLFFGLTYFKMNPMAQLNDEWTELQPLQTEGAEYKKNQIAIPIGFGFKVKLSNRWIAGVEYGIRKTHTDYLDDVSTNYPDPDKLISIGQKLSDPSLDNLDHQGQKRGDSSNNDWYSMFHVTLSFKLAKEKGCVN